MLVRKLNVGNQRQNEMFSKKLLLAYMCISVNVCMILNVYLPTMKNSKHNIKMNYAFCVQQNSKRHSIFKLYLWWFAPGVCVSILYRMPTRIEWMTQSKIRGFLGWCSCKLGLFTPKPTRCHSPRPRN